MNDFLHKLPVFAQHHLPLVGLFCLLLLGLLVTSLLPLLRKYKELTPAGLTMLINRESPLLIDLSSYDDFAKQHVPGARHVAMSQFDPEHKDLAKARELPVVLMDRDGRGPAHKAAARLIKAGFGKVYVLGQGVWAWQQAQLPLAKGKH